MTDKLKWRLADLPTASEVADLVDSDVINKEEARQILFSDTKEDSKRIKELEKDVKAKDEEINFLRELSDKLAAKSNGWQTIIREYRDYTPTWPRWYGTYATSINTAEKKFGPQLSMANLSGSSSAVGSTSHNAVMSVSTGGTGMATYSGNSSNADMQLLSKIN